MSNNMLVSAENSGEHFQVIGINDSFQRASTFDGCGGWLQHSWAFFMSFSISSFWVTSATQLNITESKRMITNEEVLVFKGPDKTPHFYETWNSRQKHS